MRPREPDWDAELEVDAYLAAIPRHLKTKGLFLSGLADRMVEAGAPRPGRYVAFANYPVHTYVSLLVECARICHPELSLGRGLRRVGHTAYPTFAATTIGRVIFAFAGSDPKAALRLAPRAYATVSQGTTEVVLEEGEGVDILRMREVYSFPQFHEVGVIEGGIRTFGGDVRIRVIEPGPGALDLYIEWLT